MLLLMAGTWRHLKKRQHAGKPNEKRKPGARACGQIHTPWQIVAGLWMFQMSLPELTLSTSQGVQVFLFVWSCYPQPCLILFSFALKGTMVVLAGRWKIIAASLLLMGTTCKCISRLLEQQISSEQRDNLT